ncbi:hypothetical protein LSUE1_G003577 [Lachnellula suecica]|uniref:Zn(2)-C6 fungal-type domain-containing protein n=1 Tax=Lachnellula suecica TaxID=602035 RepID=A0A8T9CA83_9HELO|nr:hypothetical protein LSUE1_G003577 [Lachnellula suecica]
MAASPVQSRKTGRKAVTACDRCYELKERCARISSVIACTRCRRLGTNCTNLRPLRRAGRRPFHSARESTSIGQSITSSRSSIDFDTWLSESPDLSCDEKDLLLLLLTRPEYSEHYPVSPAFQAADQKSLAAALIVALPILKHAYLAYAGALKLLRYGTAAEAEKSVSLRHASFAMNTLRSLPVSNSQDAATCLALGAPLALFVYSVVGVGVADICHFSLSTVSPFLNMRNSDLDSDTSPWQNVLVMLETMECLVYRRKATLRIQSDGPEMIDRYLGLCVPLLPFYYDLCNISYLQSQSTERGCLNHLRKQLEGVHSAIQTWQPSQPCGFIERFQTAEVVNLLAQARVYRLAGLLVCHRLRYVFGEEDSQASLLSREIMMELGLARGISKARIRCVTLPFVVAAVEVEGEENRIKALRNVDEFVDQFTPVVQNATRTFLQRVWHERDVQGIACWFDSVHKPCAVLDSIESSYFALA